MFSKTSKWISSQRHIGGIDCIEDRETGELCLPCVFGEIRSAYGEYSVLTFSAAQTLFAYEYVLLRSVPNGELGPKELKLSEARLNSAVKKMRPIIGYDWQIKTACEFETRELVVKAYCLELLTKEQTNEIRSLNSDINELLAAQKDEEGAV